MYPIKGAVDTSIFPRHAKIFIDEKPRLEQPKHLFNAKPEPYGVDDSQQSAQDTQIRHQSHDPTNRATAVVNYFRGSFFSREIRQSINCILRSMIYVQFSSNYPMMKKERTS